MFDPIIGFITRFLVCDDRVLFSAAAVATTAAATVPGRYRMSDAFDKSNCVYLLWMHNAYLLKIAKTMHNNVRYINN